MDPLTWAALLGGANVLKTAVFDAPEAEKQRKLNAEIIRYSPWTGMQAGPNPQSPNYLGAALSGGLAGAQFGQGLENRGMWQELLKKRKAQETLDGLLGSDPLGLGV